MRRAFVVVVLVIVLVLVWLVTSSLDSLVERAIESYGSELAGVAVRVDRVDISLTRGRGRLRGLSLANPPGFEARHALRVDEITLEIDTESLGGSPVVISEVLIDGPKVVYELDASGRSNFDVIRKHVAGASPSEPDESEGEPLLILIRHLRVDAGKMNIDGSAPAAAALEVQLPTLDLRDLGAPNGETPEAIGTEVLSEIIGRVVQRAARGAVGKIVEEGSGAVKGFLDRLRR